MPTLSNRQKAHIGRLARGAWEALTPAAQREARQDAEEALDEPLPSATAVFTNWRHNQQQLAIGEPSLTRATNRDYTTLKLHFQTIIDTSGHIRTDVAPSRATQHTLAKQATEPHRIARFKLNKALEAADLPEAYAAKICQTQYRCPLDQASAKQIWSLYYTVKNRTTAKRT